MTHKHLTKSDRYYISNSLKSGRNQSQIARELGVSQSTISREISRNKSLRGYRHKKAQEISDFRKKNKNKATKLNKKNIDFITTGLNNDWSPEQISGRLFLEKKIKIHYETIYRYIKNDKDNGGLLYLKLRHKTKKYKKRYGGNRVGRTIPNRIDIDERPKYINDRKSIGHWEADTIIGKNHSGVIVTIDERVTKVRMAVPLQNKKSLLVSDSLINLLNPIKKIVKSITFDNGKEFCDHERISANLDCKNYFAKPYHSWERGQNENANGLLRQYFPKNMDLKTLSSLEVLMAINKLNTRPKKCLNYYTPYESFFKKTGIDLEKEQFKNMHL